MELLFCDLSLGQFPVGMGTGAVYVTLSGLKQHPRTLTTVETVFFFINLSLFLLNSSTLLLQVLRAINFYSSLSLSLSQYGHGAVYPQQSWRLINDPVKGVFVPLIVGSSIISQHAGSLTSYSGSVVRDYHNWYN